MNPLDRPSVTTHCTIVGEIINRLANNSNYCKTLCVAVVTVLATFNNIPNLRLLIVWCIPILGLCGLDCLFVSMKKRLTEENEAFIEKVKKGEPYYPFELNKYSTCKKIKDACKALGDVSIWLFYSAMIVALVLHLWLMTPAEDDNKVYQIIGVEF